VRFLGGIDKLFTGLICSRRRGTHEVNTRFACVQVLRDSIGVFKDPGFLTSLGILLAFQLAFAAVLLVLTQSSVHSS
jgi:hypothetical protein